MNLDSLRKSLQKQKNVILKQAKSYSAKYFEILDTLPVDKKEKVWYSDIEPRLEDLEKLKGE